MGSTCPCRTDTEPERSDTDTEEEVDLVVHRWESVVGALVQVLRLRRTWALLGHYLQRF